MLEILCTFLFLFYNRRSTPGVHREHCRKVAGFWLVAVVSQIFLIRIILRLLHPRSIMWTEKSVSEWVIESARLRVDVISFYSNLKNLFVADMSAKFWASRPFIKTEKKNPTTYVFFYWRLPLEREEEFETRNYREEMN